MKQFIISEEVAQGILNYLGSQPYAQVFQLINALQQIQPIEGNGALADPKPAEKPAEPQKEEAKN